MSLHQDLRYGVRTMARAPVSTAVAVFSLALGIGATTTVFTLINGLMFRPLRSAIPGHLSNFSRVTTLSDQVDASLEPEWLMARLSGTAGAVGAFLAALGIYGLMAFTMARRTGEIALRMALGATRRDAVLLVMRSGAGLAAAGVVIGLPLAIFSTKVAASVIRLANDRTAAFALAAVVMTAVAIVAAYVPARRAARVEPMQVLRHE